uniref:Uncharacterized protein n=1 Tax=Myoviridae sp. ctgsk7 TaxID=2825151 RepID=A0A8S5PWT9_9CAUD|nr:MAG TPA: hypothetical protein [Myoviridae sp. ctgsk7]
MEISKVLRPSDFTEKFQSVTSIINIDRKYVVCLYQKIEQTTLFKLKIE